MDNKLRRIIVNRISIMLDSPDEIGIYPTGRCYRDLENDISKLLESVREEGRKQGLIEAQGMARNEVNMWEESGYHENAMALLSFVSESPFSRLIDSLAEQSEEKDEKD